MLFRSGTHFPDTDERYRGISSVRLLAYVDQLLEENGYSVGNIDAPIKSRILLNKEKLSLHDEIILKELDNGVYYAKKAYTRK